MPAFFIINGMLMHNSSTLSKPLKEAFIIRFKTLIIPFVFFEILGLFVHLYVYGILLNFKGYFFEFINLTYFNDPCWFLIAVFLSNLLFILIHRITNGYKATAISFIITVLPFILHRGNADIMRACMALGFIEFGYSFDFIFKRQRNIYSALAIAICIIVTYIQGEVGFTNLNYKNPVLYLIGAVSGTYVILWISKKLNNKIINYLGRNSMIIMATHWLLYLVLNKLFSPNDIILLLSVIAIEFPICYVLNRFFPVLIGKSKNNLLKQNQ